MERQELTRTSDEQERKIAVAILSEPSNVKETCNWWFSRSREAAILCNRYIVKKCILVEKAENFVMAEVGNLLVISFYYSPNQDIKGFKKALKELVQTIDKYKHRGVLICGDFNARSRLWGDRYNNRRGKLLADWIESADVKIINNDTISTFKKSATLGESIIDLTFATPGMSNRIRQWRVDEEMETLSDHNPIFFEIDILNNNRTKNVNKCTKNRSAFTKWKIKKFNKELYKETME